MILIVEDDKTLREMLGSYLPSVLKEKVLVAQDVPQALSFLQDNNIRLVLLGWLLDGVTAIELVKVLNTKKIEFILFTASSQAEKIAYQTKANGLLKKPCTLEELEKMIA